MKDGIKLQRGKLFTVIALALVLLLSTLVGCTTKATKTPEATVAPVVTATATAPAQIVWKFQNSYVGTAEVWGRTWAEWLSKASKGRIKVELVPADALVPTKDLHTAISKGAVTGAGVHYAGWYTAEIPEADLETGLPFMYESIEEWWEIMHLRGVSQILKDVYAKRNIYYIGAPCNLVYTLVTNYPIESFSDVKGKKIRALGAWGEWIISLGGATTSVPWAEMYTGMKLKTIDGFVTGMGILKDNKMWEVATHIIVDPNPCTLSANILINMDTFKSLPADLQELIDTQSSANILPGSMWYKQEIQRILMESQNKYGVKLVKVSAEKAAAERTAALKLWDTVGARTPECGKIVDIIKAYYREMGKLK